MFKSHQIVTKLVVFCVFCLSTVAAQAQSAQVFVSARQGLDGGTCTLANPCRTVNFALTQVQSRGQVSIIDSGTYSQITIDKSVSIVAAPGVAAVVTHAAASEAVISVNIPSNGKVTLSGLFIDGQNVTPDGVRISNSKVVMDHCTLEAKSNGILLDNTASLHISDSIFRRSSFGIKTTTPVNLINTVQELVVERCRFSNHGTAGVSVTPGFLNTVRARIRQSFFHKGAAGVVMSFSSEATIDADVEDCTMIGGTSGIVTSQVGTAGSLLLRVSGCLITAASNQGVFGGVSRGNNIVEGNATNGNFAGTFTAK